MGFLPLTELDANYLGKLGFRNLALGEFVAASMGFGIAKSANLGDEAGMVELTD